MYDEKEHPFVVHLERLRDQGDRAAMARLRRGLGKKMGAPEMYPYDVPSLPESRREQERYFLIASLFAMHPDPPSPRGISFGLVFRRVWDKSDRTDSVEKRFTNLLSADPADIGSRLRHAVSLAKARSVAIDYHRLMHDLRNWDHPDRYVQLAWARDFWGAIEKYI